VFGRSSLPLFDRGLGVFVLPWPGCLEFSLSAHQILRWKLRTVHYRTKQLWSGLGSLRCCLRCSFSGKDILIVANAFYKDCIVDVC